MRFAFVLSLAVSLLTPLCGQNAPHPARGLHVESIDWIDDGAEFLDQKRFKTSMTAQEEAMDREKLLAVALERARQEQRPLLMYVYKIVEATKKGKQMIRAPNLDLYLRQAVWSDPDVERIVNSSFVPMRTVLDEALCAKFDVRPLGFLEPALIFLSPSGEVLHMVGNLRTFDAPWFTDLLRDVLRKAHGPLETESVEAAIDRGEYQLGLDLLDQTPSQTPGDSLRRAVMYRRLRDGDAALRLLGNAEEVLQEEVRSARPQQGASRGGRRRGRRPQAPPELVAIGREIAAETGAVLTLMGRFDEAIKPLREVADAGSGGRRAEARYRLALLRLQVGDETGAMRRFQKIVQDDPWDRYARKAQVNLLVGVDDGLSLGASLFGYDRVTWLPEDAYSELPVDTRWPGEQLSNPQMIDFGVRALLAQQRADGGWNDSRYAYCPDARITPNVWVAITALACQALLRQRENFADKGAIDDALRRGERYLLDPNRINRERNEDVYADAYRLLYFALRYESEEDPEYRETLHAAMSQIVAAAGARQAEPGFWAHEYANAFCTAAMVQGLKAVEAVGVAVPPRIYEKSKLALLSARGSDGSFAYGGTSSGTLSSDSLKDASTRMPMCEAALLTLGASDYDRLSFAYENFWRYYSRIEGVRQTDFHSDGQIAGFMFMHSLYHTSLATAQLSEERAREARRRLLGKLRAYPEMDGTFMDSDELGRSYGTAMALLTLAHCVE